MKLAQLFEDNEAVSPVIGVILMVAITVILAAVIGTFVLAQADQLNESPPMVQLNYDGTPNGEYTISHSSGNDFVDTKVDIIYTGVDDDGVGNPVEGERVTEPWGSTGETVSAGKQTTVSAGTYDGGGVYSGTTIRVVWSSAEGGSSSTISTYNVS